MRQLLSVAVSLIILVVIWASVDAGRVIDVFRHSDRFWLAMSLFAAVPLTLATALRFAMLSRSPIPFGACLRLILSASTLNAVLPSKMGDIAKGWVLAQKYGFPAERAVSLVVFEKMMDMAALLLWGTFALIWTAGSDWLLWLFTLAVAGLFLLLALLMAPFSMARRPLIWAIGFMPSKIAARLDGFMQEWSVMADWFWSRRARAWATVLFSIAIWAGHLGQFWLFTKAVHADVPLLDNLAFATLSILAGLLPLTMAGIGSRDAAIIHFYAQWLSPAAGAAVGVLATSRYLLPAIAGAPFVRDYWARQGSLATK